MIAFEGVLGQPSVRILERALADGRLASSYLFEGPAGVGKELAARALGRELVCRRDGEIDSEAERRAAAGAHPDLRVFPPRDEGNRNIQVDFLRNEILPVAQFAPFEAENAVLIFPEADVSFPENHPESANALLKTLEEPRPGVHFVLLSERPDRLLPTIRSRCQRLRFQRLPAAVLKEILRSQGVSGDALEASVGLADGRADRARWLAESGAGPELVAQAQKIDESIAARDGLAGLGERLAKSAELSQVLDSLATYYRDVAAAGLGVDGDRLVFRAQAAALRQRAGSLPPARAAARVERIRRAVDTFERNANVQSALDALFFDLASI
ncbi:MAG: AAA family ATPase [Myxococcota bacterium]